MKKSPGPAKKPLTRKTSIFQRAGLVIFGLSLLVLVELILRLVPLGLQSAEDSDPFVGFSELHPLYTSYRAPDGSQRLKTSPAKLRWFNEQDFAARKEPGTFRIFSLGGSTTFGRPFKDATSFSGWLRVLLKRPAGTSGRRYEVINAGGISYASYRVAVVLKELLAYEPDLFVIYTGHNEFLEARTYGDFFFQRTKAFKARELLSKLKSYRLLDGLWQGLRERPGRGGFRQGQGPGLLTPEVQTMLDQSAGLDYYQRDSLFSRGVFEHFRFNVARMISACRRAGVPVVFMDPVDNTSDFSPFKSQHSAGLPSSERAYFARLEAQGKALLEAGRVDQGIRLIEQAAALDSLFAGVHYRLGRAYIEAGDTARAWDHLVRARELDVCPLRAQEPIHRFLQEETAGAGVDLLNLPALYARNSPGGLLGMAMLTDHIHPTPEG
ncbi:MAG: hypothetical protein U9N45_03560, partial [Gemmatimonadota bacterium]|nr:hypothetical protein [Gemmatimonadota bacterium]